MRLIARATASKSYGDQWLSAIVGVTEHQVLWMKRTSASEGRIIHLMKWYMSHTPTWSPPPGYSCHHWGWIFTFFGSNNAQISIFEVKYFWDPKCKVDLALRYLCILRIPPELRYEAKSIEYLFVTYIMWFSCKA